MVMPVGRTYRAEDEIRASRWAKRMSSSDNGWPTRELVLWVQAHTNMARNHVSDEDRDGPSSSYGSAPTATVGAALQVDNLRDTVRTTGRRTQGRPR